MVEKALTFLQSAQGSAVLKWAVDWIPMFACFTIISLRIYGWKLSLALSLSLRPLPCRAMTWSKSPSVYPDLSYRFPAPTVLYLGAISPWLGSYPIYLSLWGNQVACLWEHQHLLHISFLAVIVSEATLVVAIAIIFIKWQKQGLNSYSTQQSIRNPLNWLATRKTIT